MLEETEVTCPYCWELIPLFLDLSAGSQTYTEDCSVCCQPIVVRLQVGGELGSGDNDDSDHYSVDVSTEDE
jgi:hypothetical protein